MTYILKIALLVVTITCGTGCTTGYWLDRGRDAADMFTITGGLGVGANTRVGPLQAGLFVGFDVVGIKNGVGCTPELHSQENGFWGALGGWQINSLLFPMSGSKDVMKNEQTSFGVEVYPVRVAGRAPPINFARSPYPFISIPCRVIKLNSKPPSRKFYTQLEVAVALGPGVRLGFNPGELLDFLLGFVGVDIYSDDIERQKKQETEQTDAGSDVPSP